MKLKDVILKDNYIFVSRASTAIYSILKAKEITNKVVLVPANICYAAIYPIIYSGNKPLFVDVGYDGNVDFNTIKVEIEKSTTEIAAVIIPHMFGNPCQDIEYISKYLKRKNIVMIEDCASSMGAYIDNKVVGAFGDYTIYSFGYSKTLDVGFGGLITTKYDINKIKEIYMEISMEHDEDNEKLFSQIYRVLRNNKESKFTRKMYEIFPECFKSNFIYRISSEKEKVIYDKMDELEQVINARKIKYEMYDKNFKNNHFMKIYKFHEGAVPWRFNILLNEEVRSDLVDYLLKNKIPVSDWYPVVANMFGINKQFSNAKSLEKMILNFPLDEKVSNADIERICCITNKFYM